MKTLRKLPGAVVGVTAGFVAEYFLDPDRGKSRRAQLSDRARAIPRRLARRIGAETSARARYATGVARGAVHRVTNLAPRLPENDATLAQKVRSEVLGSAQFSHETVAVDAANGVVTLRGQLPTSRVIDALTDEVARVNGVRRVENLVHTPAAPPANKLDARRVR
jgi:osmotically-inducible protein OsmY